MTTLAPYPQYKDSGVDWLGDVPEHWNTRAIKRAIKEVSDKGYPDLPLLAATQSMGVVRKDRYGQRTVLAQSNLESLKWVQVDDFVISLRSFQGGIERAYDEGILSSAYTVIRHNPMALEAGYLSRLFKSKPFLSELELNVTGIREGQNINYGSLRESHLPLPPLDEQRAIADFLDGMDARITRFLAARRRMIALLEEQKQAIINHAVTRGLDPDVPLKDSGVDWLGEIPAHWEVRTLKRLTSDIVDCLHATPEYELDGEFPAIRTSDIIPGRTIFETARRISASEFERWTSRLQPRHGDILYSREGDYGIAAPVPKGVDLCISQRMMVFRPLDWMNCQFLMWHLNSSHTLAQASIDADGSTVPHVNISTIRNYQLAVPPITEQDAIADHIDRETSRIDALISRHRREIDLMQEYRTRLISDVVTGKLDVRGVELPAVEEVIGEEIEAAMEEAESGQPADLAEVL